MSAPFHSIYGPLVMEFTGCSKEQAGEVIQVMRDTYHTLDGLSRAKFKREAKLAFEVVKEIPARPSSGVVKSACGRFFGIIP